MQSTQKGKKETTLYDFEYKKYENDIMKIFFSFLCFL